MLTPDNKRIQNSNCWFPYDCYGRHDRYSRCDRGRKKRVIAAMTCFDLMAVISAKTGLKPGSKFNAWWRHSTNDSCSSLVSFLLSLSFAKENEEIARVNGNKGFGFEVYLSGRGAWCLKGSRIPLEPVGIVFFFFWNWPYALRRFLNFFASHGLVSNFWASLV